MFLRHLELDSSHYYVHISLDLYLSPWILRQHKGAYFMDGGTVQSTNIKEMFPAWSINKKKVCVLGTGKD